MPKKEAQKTSDEASVEAIDDEDLCPICHLLLYNPVTTRCKHSLCATCMEHWASVSVTSQMTIMAPSSSPEVFSELEETKCPMCRTPTRPTPNLSLANDLRAKYPTSYASRAEEETTSQPEKGTDEQLLTLCIGNTHTLLPSPPSSSRPRNKHSWTFFVRPSPSQSHLIHSVEVILHPTFTPSRVFLTSSPFELTRLGWGHFTLTVFVNLKEGWVWEHEDAMTVQFRQGRGEASLPLDWDLDFERFEGRGSMGRWRLKVRREEGRDELVDPDPESRETLEDGRWEVEWADVEEGDDEQDGGDSHPDDNVDITHETRDGGSGVHPHDDAQT